MPSPRTSLTFAEIDAEWGGERGVAAGYVLAELVAAFWRGAFERDGKSVVFMQLPPEPVRGAHFPTRIDGVVTRVEADGKRIETAERHAVNIGRKQLAEVALPAIGGIHWTGEEKDLAGFAARPLDAWPPLLRTGYFERFSLSRVDFLAWARSAGYAPPKFWPAAGRVDREKGVVREHPADEDARRRKKIEAVLDEARRRWPDPRKRPEVRQMARLLAKAGGYSEGTIRSILDGIYPPQRRLGINGL
jgi:hypothetical protein